MAQGDMIVFDLGIVADGMQGWEWDADVFKMGIVDNSTAPTNSTADPRWGTGGSTNFLANQVATGAEYTGPLTLSSGAVTEAADGVFMFDFANPAVISQDTASGFTDGYYAIIYNDSDAGKRCLCAIDLGGAINLQSGSLTITFHTNGLFRVTRT